MAAGGVLWRLSGLPEIPDRLRCLAGRVCRLLGWVVVREGCVGGWVRDSGSFPWLFVGVGGGRCVSRFADCGRGVSVGLLVKGASNGVSSGFFC